MLNRLMQYACVFALACGVCAAQAQTKARPQRSENEARRQTSMLLGVVVSVTTESLVLKDVRLGTTSTLSVTRDVAVVTLRQIKLSDIKETATVTVRPTGRPSAAQPDVLDIQAIYVQPKGAPAPRSLLTGSLNVEGTTPTLKLGVKTFKLRMSPRAYVFEQNMGTIDEVKAGQIVRIETKTVEDKPVVTTIAIRANIETRPAAKGTPGRYDSLNLPRQSQRRARPEGGPARRGQGGQGRRQGK